MRRTTVIVFVDICGYSRMMAEDESRALRLVSAGNALIRELAQRYGGRILKLMGDGVFLSFRSAAGAVGFAAELQTALRARNAEAPAEEQLLVRVGVHIGDVNTERGELLGSGVNIAARIESLAAPGSAWVSQAVRDMVASVPEVRLKSEGLHTLKNIPGQFHLYSVDQETTDPRRFRHSSAVPHRALRDRRVWFGAGALLSALIAGLVLVALLSRDSDPSARDQGSAATPAGQAQDPSELVLVLAPFHASDPALGQEGPVIRDLIAAQVEQTVPRDAPLSLVRVDRAPQSHQEALALGRESAAAVVVWGEILRTDAETSYQPRLSLPAPLWEVAALRVEPLDFDNSESIKLEQRRAIAELLSDPVNLALAAHFQSRRPLLAQEALARLNKPSSSSLSLEGMLRYKQGSLEQAEQLLRAALEHDADSATAHMILSLILFKRGQLKQAIASSEQAKRLAPRHAWPYANLARIYLAQDQTDQALEEVRAGLEAEPQSFFLRYFGGIIHLRRNAHLDAKLAFQQTLEVHPGFDNAHFLLWYSLRELGDKEGARRHVAHVVADPPDLDAVYLGVLKLLAGETSAGLDAQTEELLDVQPRERRCRVLFYMALWARDQAQDDSAARYLQRARPLCLDGSIHQHLVERELLALEPK